MEIKEISKKSLNRCTPEVYDEKIKKLRKEHEKLVKGMFEFIDAQGGWLDFSYRYFKGDPLMTIRLTHGEICELPMGIIKHLNNTKKKIRTLNPELPSHRGVSTTYTTQSRVRFTPMDMM